MNKKNIISIIVIFVLILIIGGIFLWWQRNKGGKQDVYKYVKPGSYIIKDTSEGKIVENPKSGLRIKVSKDWEVGLIDLGNEDSIWFLSPSSEVSEEERLLNGARVWVNILDGSNEDTIVASELKQIQNTIDSILEESGENQETKYKIQEVSGLNALKESYITKSSNREIVHISVKLPLTDKLYKFRGTITPNEESLISEFDEFLEGIEIK